METRCANRPLLAMLIPVLPLGAKTEALLHMGRTDVNPRDRPISAIVDSLGAHYWGADSDRACSRLSPFTEFIRETKDNYKVVWNRPKRFAGELEVLGFQRKEQ